MSNLPCPSIGRPAAAGLAAVLALLLSATAASGQRGALGAYPGSRVRLTVPCNPLAQPGNQSRSCRVTGVIVDLGDSVRVDAAGSTRSYERNAIRRLEVSRGSRSRWLEGGVAGLVIGATATYLVSHSGGTTSLCDRSANQDAMSSAECVGLVAAGAAGGAAIGVLIGGRIRSERWYHLPLERLRLGFLPATGFRADLTLSF
jgi:hypothetical protein